MLRLDPTRTTIEIRTRAQGALSVIAHNLSLLAKGVSGSSTHPDPATATLHVPVAQIVVNGTHRGNRVDTGTLTSRERQQIEERIHKEVFPGCSSVDVKVIFSKDRARAEIQWRRGRTAAEFPADVEANADGSFHFSGKLTVLLPELNVNPIYAPLRAFRVADAVEIRFDAVFVPE